jgi:hypothetical protein
MARSDEARLTALRTKMDQLRAQAQALEARQRGRERQADTRRKIILGGLLLDAAARDERFARDVADLLARLSRDQDRKAFEGWSPPSATIPPEPPPPAGEAP